MIEAVLLDLDDTLLGNSMETFIPRYLDLITRFAAEHVDRETMTEVLLLGTAAVRKNTDPNITNREAFWKYFTQKTNIQADPIEAVFDPFYRSDFHLLQEITTRQPVAADLVRLCFERDLKVVIATDPLFPSSAVEARLAWAGIPVDELPYTLVTTYEDMHATKPHKAYYREILTKIETPAGKAIMIGDNWENDIVPAAAIGLFTYWIQLAGAEPPDPALPTAYGSLDDFHARVEAGWLETLTAV